MIKLRGISVAPGDLGCHSKLVTWEVFLWSQLGPSWPPQATLPGASSNLSSFQITREKSGAKAPCPSWIAPPTWASD